MWLVHATDSFNLLLCSVKKATEASRPFGMELHSADSKSITLHANDDKDLQHWMDVIQDVIAALLNGEIAQAGKSGPGGAIANGGAVGANNDPAVTPSPFEELQSVKGNEFCADCGQSDPEWAAIDHGICICIECSGGTWFIAPSFPYLLHSSLISNIRIVHRSLGSHISKVRSLKLDSWEPELVLLMKAIGNYKANTSIYETRLGSDVPRPVPTSDRASREAFIRTKYVEKRWVEKIDADQLQATLHNLMRRGRPFGAVSLRKLLAQGADPSWQSSEDGTTLLHRCALDQNIACIELLIRCGARLDAVDTQGQTALHIAARENAGGVVRLLVTNGARTDIADTSGRTPLQVAAQHRAIDCQALLEPDPDVPAASGNNSPRLPPGDPTTATAASPPSSSSSSSSSATAAAAAGTPTASPATQRKHRRNISAGTLKEATSSTPSGVSFASPHATLRNSASHFHSGESPSLSSSSSSSSIGGHMGDTVSSASSSASASPSSSRSNRAKQRRTVMVVDENLKAALASGSPLRADQFDDFKHTLADSPAASPVSTPKKSSRKKTERDNSAVMSSIPTAGSGSQSHHVRVHSSAAALSDTPTKSATDKTSERKVRKHQREVSAGPVATSTAQPSLGHTDLPSSSDSK
jgi:hypothetical protein